MSYSLIGKRVFVAGHRGMVGGAIVRRLSEEGCEILTADRDALDLREQRQVRGWFEAERPHAVFMAAAKVGGIVANDSRPAEFLYDNLMIEANVMDAAHRAGVEKLLFLGSSCIYPRLAAQPISEGALLTGPLEPTNQWYAIAKIAGIMLAQAYRRQFGADFISAMPTNLYGIGDNYDPVGSHVLPALIRKFDVAKRENAAAVTIWGSGSPRREFLYVDDLAEACIFLMKNYSAEEIINIGFGQDISIADLAAMVGDVVGFEGVLDYDRSKPDGTPRKLMDSRRIEMLGWRPRVGLREGIARAYSDYRKRMGETA